jgi:competence ComEA-like helix-hairpin-helix protein
MTIGPLACSLVLLLAVAAAARQRAEDLPDAKGKDEVADTCTACHSLSRVMANRLDRSGWLQRIANHKSRGLDLSAAEALPLADYLSAYLGPPVNVNRATTDELMALPSVDEKLARAIVSRREKSGPFKKLEDLEELDGLNREIFDRLKYRLITDSEDKSKP